MFVKFFSELLLNLKQLDFGHKRCKVLPNNEIVNCRGVFQVSKIYFFKTEELFLNFHHLPIQNKMKSLQMKAKNFLDGQQFVKCFKK